VGVNRKLAIAFAFLLFGFWLMFAGVVALASLHWAWLLIIGGFEVCLFGFVWDVDEPKREG
jgi:hypothetical protein